MSKTYPVRKDLPKRKYNLHKCKFGMLPQPANWPAPKPKPRYTESR